MSRFGKRTIFQKYLWTSMIIVIMGFIILGAMTVSSVSEHWKEEKRQLFSKNAQGISKIVSEHSVNLGDELSIYDEDLIKIFISMVASNIDAEVFIADLRGNIILCSDGTENRYLGKKVTKDIISQTLNGQYIETGYIDGIYQEEHYTVGTPIYSKGHGGQEVYGAVFTSTDSQTFLSFRIEILKIVVVASLISILLSFWAIRWLSYSMTNPLRQMSEAAISLGKGDFSKRVPVNRDDEIGELAAVFNEMSDSLAVSEKVRRSFIANVSHEFKTPMTTIAGFIDGILDGTIPEGKRKYYLRIVSSEIKRLSRLIKTMLNLSRIDNDELKVNSQIFDIMSIVLDVMISFEEKINEKNIDVQGLDTCSQVNVQGDKDMIHQVVYNLIENAVKFTDYQGTISILAAFDGNVCTTSIENTGQGIPEEEIGFIFDRFYKTDKSRSKDKNGMGLGLYIVKKIINLHGGDIKALSVLGKSTTFEFWIPKNNKNIVNGDKT